MISQTPIEIPQQYPENRNEYVLVGKVKAQGKHYARAARDPPIWNHLDLIQIRGPLKLQKSESPFIKV